MARSATRRPSRTRNHVSRCSRPDSANSSGRDTRDRGPSGWDPLIWAARPVNSLAPRLAAVIFPAPSKRRNGSVMQSNSACCRAARFASSAFCFLSRRADAARDARNAKRSRVASETASPGIPATSVPRSCPSDSKGNATILATDPRTPMAAKAAPGPSSVTAAPVQLSAR